MPLHSITEPPPNLSVSMMQASAPTSVNEFMSFRVVEGKPRLVTKWDLSPSVHRKLMKAVLSQPVHSVLFFALDVVQRKVI